MLEQSKVDEMNNALANLVIKRIDALGPSPSQHELSSIAQLARVVNDAPKTIHMSSAVIGTPLKPYKRKKCKKYK